MRLGRIMAAPATALAEVQIPPDMKGCTRRSAVATKSVAMI